VALALVTGLALATLPLTWAGAALIGTLFTIAILVQSHLALYLLPFAVPLGPRLALPIGGFGAGALEIGLGLGVVAWLARAVIESRGVEAQRGGLSYPSAHPLPCAPAFLLFLGTLMLSLLVARALEPALKEVVKWWEALIAYVLVARLIRTPRQAGWLVAAILLAGATEAVFGLSDAIRQIGPPSYAILGGRFFRASGDFGQPNPFGGYMNMVWPLAASLLLFMVAATQTGRGRTRTNADESNLPRSSAAIRVPSCSPRAGLPDSLRLAAMGSLLAILLAALVLSWSRGAWLGAAAGGVVLVIGWLLAMLKSPRGSRWVIGLVVSGSMALIVALLAGVVNPPASVQGRVESITDFFGGFDVESIEVTDDNFATVERVAHWVAAWRMWADHPWLGVGIGNYAEAYPRYRLTRWEDPLGHAHNFYFNIGAETGLIGLLAYFSFLIVAAGHAARVARRVPDGLPRGVATGVLVVLLATAVHNLFDNLYVHGMAVHLGLLLGSVTALETIYGTKPLAGSPGLNG